MTTSKLNTQLCFEVYKAANQFSKLYAKTLLPYELTYPQYLVLLTLWDEDGLTSTEICDRIGVSIGTLNPILQKLIDKKWLYKTLSQKDRRASILSLTDKAKNAEEEIQTQIMEKMCCFDFLPEQGPELKQKLQELNAFLSMMNREESL
ncbi:MarR family transcriptional regulator [Solibacillus sp. CAU 1738]|uniref:MarR family winged helix-turn-helix transcriptional regulator n=1 Tax=Solibacillus sp. CAU 1738 TaxID=3140363 RepID=UPI0032607D7D